MNGLESRVEVVFLQTGICIPRTMVLSQYILLSPGLSFHHGFVHGEWEQVPLRTSLYKIPYRYFRGQSGYDLWVQGLNLLVKSLKSIVVLRKNRLFEPHWLNNRENLLRCC